MRKEILPVLAATLMTLSTGAFAQTANTPAASSDAGGKLSSFLDSVSETVKGWSQKVPELSAEAQKYSDELKAKWPEVKEQFKEGWQASQAKGEQFKESSEKWLNETFTQERVDKAQKWLDDFKDGVQDKVVDPLVPYLLSLRYPEPMQEWDAGYRRLYPIQIKGEANPLEITLPLSWALTQNIDLEQQVLMTWKSESGNGNLGVSLLDSPNGATVQSLVAGLLKSRPDAKRVKIEGTEIEAVYFPAVNDQQNAVIYYAIPTQLKAFLIAGEVFRASGQTTEELNQSLDKYNSFFTTVAKNVFFKP